MRMLRKTIQKRRKQIAEVAAVVSIAGLLVVTVYDAISPLDDNLVGFFRVVVAVTWRDNRCPDNTCLYTTSTLVSTA